MPVISILGILRQEDYCELMAILGYRLSFLSQKIKKKKALNKILRGICPCFILWLL